jgi:hypothetical protein
LNKICDINKIYVDVWYLFDFESINNNLSNSLEKKKRLLAPSSAFEPVLV